MKTKQEIISYVINHIQDNGRSKDKDDNCLYWHDGKMCAVGACLINPKKFEGNAQLTAASLIRNYSLDEFKPSFRIKNVKFWQDLQALHDTEKYWESDKSLSALGIEALLRFKHHTKINKNKTRCFC